MAPSFRMWESFMGITPCRRLSVSSPVSPYLLKSFSWQKLYFQLRFSECIRHLYYMMIPSQLMGISFILLLCLARWGVRVKSEWSAKWREMISQRFLSSLEYDYACTLGIWGQQWHGGPSLKSLGKVRRWKFKNWPDFFTSYLLSAVSLST